MRLDDHGWFADDGAAYRQFLVMRAKPRKRPITADSLVDHVSFLVRRKGLQLGMFPLGKEMARQEGDELLYRRILAGDSAHARRKDTQVLNSIAQWLGLELKWSYEPAPRSTHKVLAPERLKLLTRYKHEEDEIHRRRRAFIHLESFMGARISEVHHTNASHLDLATQDMRLLVEKPAKRGRRRELPVPKSLVSDRRPFGAWLLDRPQVEDRPELLWTTTQKPGGGTRRRNVYGGPARLLTQAYFAKEIRAIGLELGFQLNCTVMRHTVATRLLREHRFDITFVQFWLGHADIKSTMVYAEVTYDDIRDALRRSKGVDLFRT